MEELIHIILILDKTGFCGVQQTNLSSLISFSQPSRLIFWIGWQPAVIDPSTYVNPSGIGYILASLGTDETPSPDSGPWHAACAMEGRGGVSLSFFRATSY